MSHDDLRSSLGSYLLGALSPADRQTVDRHLTGCTRCRDELASYAGLPGLLSRLDVNEAAAGTLLPPPSLLPSVLAAVERERHTGRRSLARWRTAAAGVSVAAAIAGILTVTDRPTGPPDLVLRAAPGLTSSGTVALRDRPWGTEVHLRLRDLPAAGGYTAWAVDRRGIRTQIASWGPTRQRAAEVPGAVPLDVEAVAGLVVETDTGAPCLSLPGSS